MKKLLLLASLFTINKYFSQCIGNEPVINLGNDTILCQGQSLSLIAPNGYDEYIWSNGFTASNINVNSPGTYYVTATVINGTNELVVNGDFENGNTGFTSNYTYVSNPSAIALWDPGKYSIGNNPQSYHSNFNNCSDYSTTGTGKMYIANGASTPNTIVWSQTINVQTNTNYNFSAWVMNVVNGSTPAILQFSINGTQIGNVFSPLSGLCNWSQFFVLWNSSSNTTATISIINQNTIDDGNDFALDDISFIPYCQNTDTIVVQYDTLAVNLQNQLTFCSYEKKSLTAIANYPSSTFEWNTNETTSSIYPKNSGLYTVNVTSPNNCTITEQSTVTINQAPVADFSFTPNNGIVPVTVDFTNTSQDGYIYYWDFGNDSLKATDQMNGYTMTYTEEGNYEAVLIVHDMFGCKDTTKKTIIVLDPVVLETANVFTPNGDLANDVYQFKMDNITNLNLTITNRWGNVVKIISKPEEVWDGKDLKGNEVIDGVYFYTYDAVGKNNETFSGQGFIHLTR